MKSEKTNMGKGVQPVSNAMYYKMAMPDGSTKYATIPAYQVDKLGRYKAWVTHPDFGTELMTEREGRLEGFVPVVALTLEDMGTILEAVAEKYEARIAALEAQLTAKEPAKAKAAKATKVEPVTDDLDPMDLVG
jgi:hypothetical protein